MIATGVLSFISEDIMRNSQIVQTCMRPKRVSSIYHREIMQRNVDHGNRYHKPPFQKIHIVSLDWRKRKVTDMC